MSRAYRVYNPPLVLDMSAHELTASERQHIEDQIRAGTSVRLPIIRKLLRLHDEKAAYTL